MFGKLSSLRKKKEKENSDAEQRRASASAAAADLGRRSSASDTPSLEPTSSFPLRPARTATSSTAAPSLSSSSSFPSRLPTVSESGPLGLSVAYSPEDGRKVDLIFVHGLGGTSRWTWSKDRRPELFWPSTFLSEEPDLCQARVMTFGYDSRFQKAGSVTTSIWDFAKALLFELKYAKDEYSQDLGIGKVPLIFVVHSMGGLIVKEAYMQGHIDPEYESIIKAISAITFLATPHRGTSLAQTLNRILDSTMISNSKQYVADLRKNSPAIQKLNDQFRHIAPRLDIVSFYETLPTSLGMKGASVKILEPESSVLGYPGELSKPLHADHHGVCKFDSPSDPNYILVRNVLQTLVGKIISKNTVVKKPDLSSRRASLDLKALLAVSELPSADYIFFRDQWTSGTNDWIVHDQRFRDWRNAPTPTHRILWLSGGAATGKSVMSSFIVNQLVEDGLWCQYFFIRFGDRQKRTLSLIIRSLAFQLAQWVPGFLQRVVEIADEGIDFETADPSIVWDRVFKSILFKSDERQPLYWILDGLDEADNPRAVVKLLSDIASSSIPIRILFTGRRTPELMTAFQKVPDGLDLKSISIEGHLDDLRCHIRQELTVSGGDDLRQEIERRIIEGSQNNFLWVRLAVEKVNQCVRYTDIDLALQQLPVGMEALYDRMATSIVDELKPAEKMLATKILECVSCALRVLKVGELSQALGEETAEMIDIQQTITGLCRGFVVIDNGSYVAMIHQTARDYLLDDLNGARSFTVDRHAAHRQLFLSCLRCLMSTGLRAGLSRGQKPEFLDYAAIEWSAHLLSSKVCDAEGLKILRKFLTGNWILTWIHILAASGQLRVLVRTSKNLSRLAAKWRAREPTPTAESMSHSDLELIESWAVDLLRIVGKFSNLLRRKPDSVYKFIPPFCPKSSTIYRLFGRPEAKNLSVTGLSGEVWDDSIARISLGGGPGTFASYIHAAGSQIAVLASSGSVFICDSSDFQESTTSPIEHRERVDRMALNGTATLLATYGYRTTKVWDLSTGICKVSVTSVESKTRPLAMLFIENSTKLLIGSDDRRLRSLALTEAEPSWHLVAELFETEIEGHYLNSASHMALSEDGRMAAVAYRSHPLSAWETDGPELVGHCWRKDESVAIRELRELVWNPHAPELIGLNLEGVVFKWSPYEGEIEEIAAAATKLAISKDGELFATGDGHGRVKLYATSTFSLLHQLASQDTVFGLSFSPDSRRLYDIRGYYANAWEPSALTRFAEESSKDRDSISETDSLSQTADATVVLSGAVDSITALSGSPRGRLYCCGTYKGVVSLHDTVRGKIADLHVSKAKFTIETIIWSGDGKFISFADLSRQVVIFAVKVDTSTPTTTSTAAVPINTTVVPSPAVEQLAAISMRKIVKGPILQLLFHPSAAYVLVHSASQIFTISIASLALQHTRDLEKDAQLRWIPHPHDPALVIGIGLTTIYVFDWELVERRKYSTSWPASSIEQVEGAGGTVGRLDGKAAARNVDRLLVSHTKKHIVVQTSGPKNNGAGKQFFFLETNSISAIPNQPEEAPDQPTLGEQRQAADSPSIKLVPISSDLSRHIALPLGFFFSDRLVFLAKNFSIYTVQLPWSANAQHNLPVRPRPAIGRSRPKMGGTMGESSTSSAGTSTLLEEMAKELFALPGDWISRDCLSVCSLWAVERSLLCPRNGEVAVVKCMALA